MRPALPHARPAEAFRAGGGRAPGDSPVWAAPAQGRGARPARPAPCRSRGRRRGCRRLRCARAPGSGVRAARSSLERSSSSSSPASRPSSAILSKRAAGRATSSPSGTSAPLPRRTQRRPTRSSSRRRATNASALSDGWSSHWASSIASSVGASVARLLQHPEQSEADSPLERLLPLRLGPQQRHLERAALRRGQIGHGGLGHIREQIAERGVGHLRLALARAAAEDALPVGGSRDQALVEERRLSDAGLALDQQRSGTGADRAEEFLHAFELGVAAYERARLRGVRQCPSPGRRHPTPWGLLYRTRTA